MAIAKGYVSFSKSATTRHGKPYQQVSIAPKLDNLKDPEFRGDFFMVYEDNGPDAEFGDLVTIQYTVSKDGKYKTCDKGGFSVKKNPNPPEKPNAAGKSGGKPGYTGYTGGGGYKGKTEQERKEITYGNAMKQATEIVTALMAHGTDDASKAFATLKGVVKVLSLHKKLTDGIYLDALNLPDPEAIAAAKAKGGKVKNVAEEEVDESQPAAKKGKKKAEEPVEEPVEEVDVFAEGAEIAEVAQEEFVDFDDDFPI